MKTKRYTCFPLFLLVIAVALVVLPSPFLVFSETNITTGDNTPKLENPLTTNTLEGFIRSALLVVRNIGFLVAVLFIVYAGFLFVTAQGDETKLKRAKSAFLWAIVGTAVLLGAWVFAEILENTVDQIEVSYLLS